MTGAKAAREATEGLRKLASALGMLVETAFPRDKPKVAPDEGIDTVAYPETSSIVVVTDPSGKVTAVRYGAIELPFKTMTGMGPWMKHQSAIVSMRLRRRPS